MQTDAIQIETAENASSMLPPATGSSHINLGPTERIISVFAGAAAAVFGLRHISSKGGVALALGGGYLLTRGLSGYCALNNLIDKNTVNKKSSAMEVSGTFIINKSRPEVYAYWRRLENLPRFMEHLEDVKETGDLTSTWKAKIPGGLGTVTWEAQITEDKAGELLSWASLPGSTVDNAGEVRFKDAPGDWGTEITVNITYRLPAGDIGSIAAKLFNPAIENMMKEDIRRFKSVIETNDVASDGLTSQPEKKTRKPRAKKQTDQYSTPPSDREQTFNENPSIL